jgi:hypothetical protein
LAHFVGHFSTLENSGAILKSVLRFKVCVSNGIYEVNIGRSFKNSNTMKSSIPFDESTLNPNPLYE